MASTSTPKPVSVTALKKRQEEGITAPGPSGNHYRLRAVNLERHTLAGGLPAKLRAIALQGEEGIQQIFAADDDTLAESGRDVQAYLDGLVRKLVVEPSLHGEAEIEEIDEESGEPVKKTVPKTALLPPIDYRWLCAVAMGEFDEDGEGRRLWGREPLSRWLPFRDEHGCAADCAQCRRALDRVSLVGADE